MAKKLLYALLFICAFSIRGFSQIVITPSDTISVDTVLTSGQGVISLSVGINNTSATDTVQMKWKVLLNTIPHPWLISFCDPSICWSEAALANGARYALTPNQRGLMKLDVTPYCLADSPTFRILTWSPTDSANTAKILTWKMNVNTANCLTTTGVSNIPAAQVSIYPNPVRNDLKISLANTIENGQVEIYNMIGSKIYSQSITRTKDIDVSSLESGLYVARISDNGKVIATKKFTKAE